MQKIDFKKELKHLYKASAKTIEIVNVPRLNYLAVEGGGGPNSTDFQQAIEALYPVSYTLKFIAKKGELGTDFVVMPLEGLWWAEDMSVFTTGEKDKWQWQLMIMQPEFITRAMVDEAVDQVRAKKNPVVLEEVKFIQLEEGKCAQTLHIGPFENEGSTIVKIHELIEQKGVQLSGRHHEIYLSDMRRVPPEKYRTIIRQPMTLS